MGGDVGLVRGCRGALAAGLTVPGNDIALIITAVGSLISAITASGALLIGALNARKLNNQGASIEVIHKATNSLTDRLVASTAVASHAEGKAEGNTEGRAQMAEVMAGATKP